ncbi:MAG: response regulator [Candidatus Omnitrophica bacterium]|nr:response regulator [Candidatus Omnitrophota bacterium]
MEEKKKILIVEDDKDINRTLEIFVSMLGYEPLIAYDGMDGLNKAKTQNPDVIILDLMIPKLPGEELCRELKLSEEYKHISVIMLTAKDTDVDRIVGRVIGADVYMFKPCDLDKLERNISEVLKKQKDGESFPAV